MSQTLTPKEIPEIFMIELFAGCNLRCPLCHAGRNELVRKSRTIDYDQYVHIFTKIRHAAKTIYFMIWGESTLNKDLIRILRYTNSRNPDILTVLSTNGNNLPDEYIYDLVSSGLRQIIVDVDGFDQETYEKYRVNGKLSDAIHCLEVCSRTKQELDSPIIITAQSLQLAHNIKHGDRIAHAVDFPGVSFGHKPLFVHSFTREEYLPFVSSEVEIQEWSLEKCFALTDAITIQSDGVIIPCCQFPEPPEDYNLGNIFDATLDEICLNRDRIRIQNMISQGIAPTKYCRLICDRGAWDNEKLRFTKAVDDSRSQSTTKKIGLRFWKK